MDGLVGTKAPGYSHTQKAPLCLILYGSALACITLALMVGESAGIYIAGGVSLLIVLLAPCFHHLTVADQGDVLVIRSAPSRCSAGPCGTLTSRRSRLGAP